MLKLNIQWYHCDTIGSFWSQLEKVSLTFSNSALVVWKNWWKLLTITLFFKQFSRYPSLYVLGAFPAWLKVFSRTFCCRFTKNVKKCPWQCPFNKRAMAWKCSLFLILLHGYPDGKFNKKNIAVSIHLIVQWRYFGAVWVQDILPVF